MTHTKGGLVAAKICQVNETGGQFEGGLAVECMFNPFEYTITKSNFFSQTYQNQKDIPRQEFQQAGAQTLRLNLTFDTYESGEDVTQITNKLWKLMEVKTRQEDNQNEKVPPPNVAFEWGVFRFVAVITQMTQRFTLFNKEGTPVRARVDISFTQQVDLEDHKKGQNPTSGGETTDRVYQVNASDRLDTIAHKFYSDSTKWRRIAETNHIRDPFSLRPGQTLTIPSRK